MIYWREQRVTSEDTLTTTFAESPDGKEVSLIGFEAGKISDSSRITVTIDGSRLEQKFHGSNGQGKEFQGTRKLVLAPDGKSMSAVFEANRFGEGVAWTEVWDRF